MAENIKLRFFRNTGIPENPNQGDIVFNPQTKRIGVYNGTELEQYGSNIEDATFSGGILTIKKKAVYNSANSTWENPTIVLDFSDVASASDVTKVVGGLKEIVDNQGTAITALQNTVGNANSGLVKNVNTLKTEVEAKTTGLLDRVTALENSTGSGENALGGRVTALENTVYDSTNGLVKKVADNSTAISSLQTGKADKATTLAGYGITNAYTKDEVNSKLSSAYKAQGSKTANQLTSSLLIAANEGYVYNISDALTITDSNKSLFVEGVKSSYPAGTNVVVVKVGSAYKFDVIAGFVDLTAYAKTADQKTITDALSGRITTLEKFKNGTDGYQYVKNLTSTHTNSSTAGDPTNMISVTANNKATGEVTININEAALDAKLKSMDKAISDAASAAVAGVLSIGGKTGAIDVRSGSTAVADVNFTVTQESGKNAILKGTVVRPANASKVDNYKAGGSASRPVYISSTGVPTQISVEANKATQNGTNLVTSGAAYAAVSEAQSTLQTHINNLNTINWVSF